MEFMLRYRGRLSGEKKNSGKEKQRLREYFHPQLKELCIREPMLQGASSKKLHLAELKGGRIEPPRDAETGYLYDPIFYRVPVGGIEFVPLVTRPHELACQLDIVWLRREKPGDIVHGGDLDNRLKNLLDGLRMPLHESELAGSRLPKADPPQLCYCLMEDDALVTRFTVTTYQLLEPLQEGVDQHDVELLIKTTIQPIVPMVANIGF